MHHIIVPGWNGSDADHWQSVWQSDWLPTATRIAPSSWTHPTRDNWTAALDHRVQESTDDTILIAHSLGCYAVAHWLTRTPNTSDLLRTPASQALARTPSGRVRGVFLVAPPDQRAATFPADLLATFVEPNPTPINLPAVLIASEDDPYCSLEAATRIAHEWQIPLIPTGKDGHLNSDSNLGPWPLGQNLLTAFTAGITSRPAD